MNIRTYYKFYNKFSLIVWKINRKSKTTLIDDAEYITYNFRTIIVWLQMETLTGRFFHCV